MKLKIEYISKDEIKPYANNAKIHDQEQIKQIKKSIEEFGFNDPIAVWKDNEVIEGHGRLLAVMEMDGITEVPIIRLDNLSDEQRRAYMLIHNQLTINTPFDIELLQMELDSINTINMLDFELPKRLDIDKDEFITNEDIKETTKEYKCPHCKKTFIV